MAKERYSSSLGKLDELLSNASPYSESERSPRLGSVPILGTLKKGSEPDRLVLMVEQTPQLDGAIEVHKDDVVDYEPVTTTTSGENVVRLFAKPSATIRMVMSTTADQYSSSLDPSPMNLSPSDSLVPGRFGRTWPEHVFSEDEIIVGWICGWPPPPGPPVALRWQRVRLARAAEQADPPYTPPQWWPPDEPFSICIYKPGEGYIMYYFPPRRRG